MCEIVIPRVKYCSNDLVLIQKDMTQRIHAVMEIGPEINFYKSTYSETPRDTASHASQGRS